MVFWSNQDTNSTTVDLIVTDESDPWHVLEGAELLICEPDDPTVLIAAINGIPIHIIEPGGQLADDQRSAAQWVEQVFPAGVAYACPFNGRSLTVVEAIVGLMRR